MAANAGVSREVVEIIANSATSSAPDPQVQRIAAEIIASPFTTPNPTPQITKLVAEVIGQHEAVLFAKPQVNRLIEEIVGSAARLGSGFNLPNIGVSDFTLFMVINPIDWGANSNHEFSLVSSEPGIGIFIRQTENANEVEMQVRSGTTGLFKGRYTAASLNDKHIVTMRFDLAGANSLIRFDGNLISSPSKTGTFDTLTLKFLCGLIEYNKKIKGEIAEVILYTNQLSVGFIELAEEYLNCKWLGPGPSEANNFCVPI